MTQVAAAVVVAAAMVADVMLNCPWVNLATIPNLGHCQSTHGGGAQGGVWDCPPAGGKSMPLMILREALDA